MHSTQNSSFQNFDPEEIIDTKLAAKRIDTTPRFLEQRRITGDGPVYFAYSKRCVRYKWGDIVHWLEQRKRRHTSDNGEV